jgi:SHS2 domain-containing protein
MSAWHHFHDHTSEVELSLRADSLPELFVQAGRALAELLLGPQAVDRPAAPEALRIAVRAPDAASLLVDWINELIYRTETAHRVFTEFDVVRLTDGEIVADLRGLPEPPLAAEVKAATLHQAWLRPLGSAFEAHVVLDV